MASPAATATLCQLARRGWPLLAAALLTLLLGWSALHEGRGTTAAHWVAAAPAATLDSAPHAPEGGTPPNERLQRSETPAEGGHEDPPAPPAQLCQRTPPIAPPHTLVAPAVTTAVATRNRRQPPSHAPPAAVA
ncbi:hypothetical protein [Stenotrophomonas sp.]|uniref:hypothetical protein n=1 Tax=Stenotrophomonas sp. TaxID=69392 RepID=UPI002899AEC0|nr:hypothetical protein [Stenotrophomonas sp.]